MLILQVAISTPLRRTFDYLAPENTPVNVGARVRVSFGKRDVVGVVVGTATQSDFPIEKLKTIDAIIDDVPLLDESLLSLCQFASDYYQHPIGDVVVGTLPKKVREGAMDSTEARAVRPGASGLYNALEPATCGVSPGATEPRDSLQLTDEQRLAVTAIASTSHFQPFLLAGITGSGKTEVYLRVIAQALQNNKQALVLVPEIALTPQTVSRFQARLNAPVLLLHSGLTPVKRCQSWLQATNNSPCVVIGTRSAVFAPLKNIGVIVVDEEHDVSFKQQTGFRYSARDVAVMRAKILDIPVILGTATPSLESFYNVQQKKYQLLTLSHRAGNACLPDIILHNICREKLQSGLSKTLIEKMRTHLAQGNQILVFLNRRGYAPVLLCHHCGYAALCPHCDARITVHDRPKKLVCHHCDYQSVVPRICPQCQQSELTMLGVGTEQLENTIAQLFPDKKIGRMDRDAIKNFKTLETTLESICAREIDIIVGTQMLVKGHHFEHVTLVAAIDIDQALFSADFRATERLGQSLVQVAGRAGRAEKHGEVFIQTHQPDHPLLKKLFSSHYAVFSDALLTERLQSRLPPVEHMVVLRAEAKNKEAVHRFLAQAKAQLKQIHAAGPFPSMMERKAGVYRAQLLLQSAQRGQLKKSVSDFLAQCEQDKQKSRVKWVLDVDPVEVA